MKSVNERTWSRAGHRALVSTLAGVAAALWIATANAQVNGVTIQENSVGFCAVEGTTDSNHTGFTGTGFANADNAVGRGVNWSVDVAADGIYQLEWRFANGSTARPGSVKVNGTTVTTVSFPSTGVWTSWTTISTTVNLTAGRNGIRLESTTAAGLANIDSLAVTGGGTVQAADCNTAPTAILIQENTTGFCRVEGVIASNHAGFTGTGFADGDAATGAGINWKLRVPASGNYLLEWRVANGSTANRPASLLINGSNASTVNFPSAGSWTSWAVIGAANIALGAGETTIRLQATTAAGLPNIDWLRVTGNGPEPVECAATNDPGADFYVAPGGSNSNPGTIDRPFASLQRAIDAAEPGDLVYVRGGVYNIVNPAIPSAGINFSKSGTSDSNRIRYFAYPGERPVLDFSNLRIQPDPNYTFGVNVTGSYLHIKGFEIRNVPMNTRSNNGVRVGGNAYRNIFELLDIHHIEGTGLFISGTRGGHLILNSDAHDNYDRYSHQGDGQNGDGFGVHYQESGEVTVFRGCRAWWNSDDGWDFISQEIPVTVENSWAMGSGYIYSGTARSPTGNGAGFKVGSSRRGIRHVVRNNLAWGNRSQGFYANHSAGGNDWFNNTSYNNGVQYDMLASSWDSNGNRTDGVILPAARAHRMRNNIGYPNNNRNMQGVDNSFNTWNLGLTPSSGDFESLSDAGFMGPRGTDGNLPNLSFLKLRAGSQMIDRGTNVGLPFSGSNPDLGAYER
jgi:hypothetical protein